MINNFWKLAALPVLFPLLLSCSRKEAPPAPPNSVPAPPKLKIGFVLHGRNDFTQAIQHGAENAGRAMNIDVEVVASETFSAPESLALFHDMIQRGKDGLIVVPTPADLWIGPIQEATDRGIPVITTALLCPNSASPTWFGTDNFESGRQLAVELRKLLEAAGKKQGQIVTGICSTTVPMLARRYQGFQKGFAGSAFRVSPANQVGSEAAANAAAWEKLTAAHPEAVAMVGLCSADVPNLAAIKTRTHANWLIAGFDLRVETLEAIRSGTAQLAVGQSPYLQGYLPVLSMMQRLQKIRTLPAGWIDVGVEIVRKESAEIIYKRTTERAYENYWYAEAGQHRFYDIITHPKPLPKTQP